MLIWILTTGTEIIWSISIAIRIVHFINFVTKTQVIGLIFLRCWYNLNRMFIKDSWIIILDQREIRKMIIYGKSVYHKLLVYSFNIQKVLSPVVIIYYVYFCTWVVKRCYRKTVESVARFDIFDCVKSRKWIPFSCNLSINNRGTNIPVQNQSPDRTKNLTSRLNFFFLPLYTDLD